MQKWLWPALLVGGVGLLLILWLRREGKKRNPNADFASALCTGAAAYFGGAQGGAQSIPLCSMMGEALAPIVGSALGAAGDIVDESGQVIVGAVRAVGGIVDAGGNFVAGFIDESGKFVRTAIGTASGLVEGAGSVVTGAAGAVVGAAGAVAGAAGTVAGGLVSGTAAVGNTIGGAVSGAVDAIGDIDLW